MNRYPSFKPIQVALVLLIGCAIALGSLVHAAWATPTQDPHRQSVPTLTPTPTSTLTPTSTPTPTREKRRDDTPTPTVVVTTPPVLPETGGGGGGVILEPAALVLIGGGLAAFVAGLWLRVRQRWSLDSGETEE